MANPRNVEAVETTNTEVREVKPASEWNYLGLGSVAIKDGKIPFEGNASFTINSYNAKVILDAAKFVINNPAERISLTAYPFYEGSVSGKKAQMFTHELKVSRDTISKFGKLEDYVERKA